MNKFRVTKQNFKTLSLKNMLFLGNKYYEILWGKKKVIYSPKIKK